MVASKPHEEDRCFVDEVGVELVIAKTGGRCVQRGVGEVEVGRPVTAAAIAT